MAHYGGTGVGGPKGDTKDDEIGIETSKNLGKRVTELAITFGVKFSIKILFSIMIPYSI